MSETVPELLWLKYRGIRAPSEIEGDAKRLGYKCRKYSRWDAVHVASDSSDLLRKVGDDLLDAGEISLEDFGHLSLIWERVQRWTKDKDGLSLEPDKYPEYESLERLLFNGSQAAGVVDGLLSEVIADLAELPDSMRWKAFKAICLGRFFSGSRMRKLVDPVPPEPRTCKQIEKYASWVARQAVKVYDAVGYEVSGKSADEKIDLILEEMGLQVEFTASRTGEGGVNARRALDVVVEENKRTDLRIVEAAMHAGTMVVKLNIAHPSFQSTSPFCAMLRDRPLWNCIGWALRDNLGQLEELQSFFDSLGIRLAAWTRMNVHGSAEERT